MTITGTQLYRLIHQIGVIGDEAVWDAYGQIQHGDISVHP